MLQEVLISVALLPLGVLLQMAVYVICKLTFLSYRMM